MDKIATIARNHIVALFTPDEAAIRKAALAGMMSLVIFVPFMLIGMWLARHAGGLPNLFGQAATQ